MQVKEKRERNVVRRRQKKIRTQQERTCYVWCLMGCKNSRVRQTYKTRYLQTYSTCADIHLFVLSAFHSLHQCVCQPIFPCLYCAYLICLEHITSSFDTNVDVRLDTFYQNGMKMYKQLAGLSKTL